VRGIAAEDGHSHGPFVDRSILRSRAGIKAVSISLAVLTVTATVQTVIYALTISVALLADLIHNFGDALTAIPLGSRSSSAASAGSGGQAWR
jgi:divalent metal cation (Fe/Co/Zn/Cd) transporter